jgi:hypothetical protein
MSYTCPVCLRTSHNPNDDAEHYCGYCHDWTWRTDGNQRHSSSSTPAGQEREMRMPTNDEDGKAQPEMSEVPREGDCPSLQQLRGERMEPKDESTVRPVQWSGISGSVEPKWTTRETTDGTIQWNAPIPPSEPSSVDGYPSKYRFYWGAVGLGMATGIAWTIFMLTPLVARYIPKAYAITFLYLFVAANFAAQGWTLYRWNKALAKHRIELANYWDEHFASMDNPWRNKGETTKERYGLTDEE